MSSPDRVRRSRTGRAVGLVLATSTALAAMLVAACSSADAPGGAREETPSTTVSADEPRLATRARFGVVTGGLPAADRQRLRVRITEVVDAWIDAAYTGGDYPRADFEAFADFTPGARRLAAQDVALLTNAGVGAQLDSVRATQRLLRIDVLAVRQRAVAVTARVQLELQLGGPDSVVQRTDRVTASLHLTHHGSQGWQVFAYDVTRGLA